MFYHFHLQYLPSDLALLSIDAADDPVVNHPVLAALGLAALIGRRNIRATVPLSVDSVGKPFSWLIDMIYLESVDGIFD